MIAKRATLPALLPLVLAALLGASQPTIAQSRDRIPSPQLSAAIQAYHAGDLAGAEAGLRRLAAGDPDAKAWLGAVLIDRNQPREAIEDLQQAEAAGSIEAAHQLGVAYAQGLAGLPRDEAHAAQLFEKAARAGHRRAALNLGILYFRGQGVKRDLIQARAWLEKAAAGEDPYALYALARTMEETEGTALADPIRAADLYRRAANKGYALAELRYGMALAEGNGVKKDIKGAQQWLIAAQKAGLPEAALALGDMTARLPAQRDKAQNDKILQIAVAWYAVAANAGVPSAQFKLANAFVAGSGMPRDPAQAQQWYVRAAQQGLPEAQQALGLLMISGVAGTADPIEGYKWLLIAESSGNPDAKAAREKMSTGIAEVDRKRAEGLAAEFKPVLERPLSDTTPAAPTTSRP
jgi:hypothetical protein